MREKKKKLAEEKFRLIYTRAGRKNPLKDERQHDSAIKIVLQKGKWHFLLLGIFVEDLLEKTGN